MTKIDERIIECFDSGHNMNRQDYKVSHDGNVVRLYHYGINYMTIDKDKRWFKLNFCAATTATVRRVNAMLRHIGYYWRLRVSNYSHFRGELFQIKYHVEPYYIRIGRLFNDEY